jgi:hypothetical protein
MVGLNAVVKPSKVATKRRLVLGAPKDVAVRGPRHKATRSQHLGRAPFRADRIPRRTSLPRGCRLIGRDPDQANGRLCLNLGEDVERLAAMNDLELQSHLSDKPSPIRRLKVNAAPRLTAPFDAPGHMLGGSSIDEVESRARRMKDEAGLRARLIAAYVASREPYPLSPHIEERIMAFRGRMTRCALPRFMTLLGRSVWPLARASRTSVRDGSGFVSSTSRHVRSPLSTCE